jgi:hypothetical protein
MESVEQREASVVAQADEPAREARARRGVFAAVFSARTVYLAVGALVVGAAFGYLQFSTRAICCGDFDGYYHVRWSQLLWDGMRAGHVPPRFEWLPLTTLNARDYVDHHLLFHLMQAPFTRFGNEILGAKISAWLFASLAVFSCYWLMVRHRVTTPLLWLVALLASSAPFLFRMNMTKAMSVSIVLLVVGIHLLFRRKYLWLLPLAFLFTLTYDMFVLLILAAFIWTCVVAWSERRLEWQPVLWVAVGVAAGLVINPYFPHNLRLLYEHAWMKVHVSDPERPSVGNEWYPYESWTFLSNCAVAFCAMLVGYVTFRWEDRRRADRPLFFLVLSTLLLIANAKWRRYAEFFPPFAVLFAAFTIKSLASQASTVYGRLPAAVLDELRPFLDREAHTADGEARERWWRRAEIESALVAAIFSALLLTPFVKYSLKNRETLLVSAGAAFLFFVVMILTATFRDARRAALTALFVVLTVCATFTVWTEGRTEIKDSSPPEEYRAGMEWIRKNVPAGETIFNTDWDDFPKLFFYDPTHRYISGLDPTYLYDANHELSKLYEEITLGKVKDPAPLIRERFGARYVFTDNEKVHDDFYNAAMDSGWFDEVFSDEKCGGLTVEQCKCNCTILRMRDQKGEPPPDAGDTKDDDTDQPDDSPAVGGTGAKGGGQS